MEDIKGKTAVVTGGASGIGRAIALALSREGARVVIADLDEAGITGTVEEISRRGGEAVAVRTDVSDSHAVQDLADRAWSEYGPVRILCNNAGVGMFGGLETMTLRDWTWIMGVNVWGVIHGLLAFVPRMIAEGKEGHIVNTASISGLVPNAYLGAYTTTKYAVVGLSECLRKDLRAYGIGVSVLCPMGVDTRITEAERNRPEHLKNPGEPSFHPSIDFLGRIIAPDQVADRVISAIKRNKLYILTHRESQEPLRRRFRQIEDAVPSD